MHAYIKYIPFAGLLALMSAPGFAADAPALDKADTAWGMVSGLLVLLMTIPGIALFYT